MCCPSIRPQATSVSFFFSFWCSNSSVLTFFEFPSCSLLVSNVLQISFLPLWYQSSVSCLRFILLDSILCFLLAFTWRTMQPVSLANWPCASLWLKLQWLQPCIVTSSWDVTQREWTVVCCPIITRYTRMWYLSRLHHVEEWEFRCRLKV